MEKEIYQDKGKVWRLGTGKEAERLEQWRYDYSENNVTAMLKLMRQDGEYFLFHYPHHANHLVHGQKISEKDAQRLRNADRQEAITISRELDPNY